MNDINEIKKLLYKENPLAHLLGVTLAGIDYRADVDNKVIFFQVPLNDLGDATFYSQMPAKHLIRYIHTISNME